MTPIPSLQPLSSPARKMKRWPTKPLGDLCDVEGGNAAPQGDDHFKEGTIPFVRMKDLGREHFTNNLTETDDKLTAASATANRMKFFEPGCILFPRSGSVALNHRAILGVRACIVSHIGVLQNIRPEVSVGYLYLYLTTFDMTALSKKTTGVDSIAFSDVKRIPIPVPPLAEQERIVKLLDEADELRKRRAQADRRTAALLPALFHEMFGDPASNPHRWPKVTLGKLCDLVNGAPFKPKDWDGSGLPIVRIQNLNDPTKPFNYTSKKLPEKFRVRPNDILLSWSGTPGTSFGCFRWRGVEGWLNQHIFNVKLQPGIDGEFFIQSVNARLDELIARAHGGVGLQHVTKGTLNAVSILVPPLPLQQEFAQRVTEIRTLEAGQAASRLRLEALFQSMLHRAFNGEL